MSEEPLWDKAHGAPGATVVTITFRCRQCKRTVGADWTFSGRARDELCEPSLDGGEMIVDALCSRCGETS